MNAIALFGFGLVILILQTTVFGLLGVSYLKAPLILCVLIYAAFYLETIRGLILSFLLGYAVDVYSGGVQGITPVVMVALCLVGKWMSRGMIIEGKVAMGSVAFTFGVVHSFLWMVMEALVSGRVLPEHIPIFRILLRSLILGIVSPLLVGIAAAIDRLVITGGRRLQQKRP